MDSPTTICETEIPLRMQNIDAFTVSFAKSLQSLRETAQQTSSYQVQLEEVKGKLKEVEDDLVKVLAVKTRKEAKRMALMDAIASAKTRVENLNTNIKDHRTKKQEYTAFLSQQSLALAESARKLNESIEHKDETQDAISWYNRVLGFHVKGGRGVKFTFKNINLDNLNEEFCFTVCHENNTYTLLSCEPPLNGIKDLIHELNKTNGLFKFVRVMRTKFQEAAAQGGLVLSAGEHEASTFVSTSAPVASARSDSNTEESEPQVELLEDSTQVKNQNARRRVKSTLLSPESASSVRQSPRLKVRK